MKVLMLNGSAHTHGNTYIALEEIGKTLKEEGIDYEIFQMGGKPVRDCIGCGQCTEKGCVFDDDAVNEFVAKAKEADGFVFGTPVYYAHPSGRVQSFLDRVFYSSGRNFACKPGAAVAVARRGGCSASFDVMNKYFGISQMPVAGSTYWNSVHGRSGICLRQSWVFSHLMTDCASILVFRRDSVTLHLPELSEMPFITSKLRTLIMFRRVSRRLM